MNESNVLERVPEIEAAHKELVQFGGNLLVKIETDEQMKAADDIRSKAGRWLDRWHELIDPAVEKAHAAHKELVAVRKKVAQPFEDLRARLGVSMATYDTEQKRKAAEEEAKLQAQLKKQQEDTLLDQAQQLEAAGQKDLADAVMNTPVATPVFNRPVARPANTGFRTTYSATVLDMKAFVQAVAEGKVPMAAIAVNQSFLNKQASALKHELKYPGVKVNEHKGAVDR